MDAFLVRVWHPATEPIAEEDGLRGTVVHLPSRRTVTFRDRHTLLAILEGSDPSDDDHADDDHDRRAPT